jgi:hypothetical protein
VIRENTERTPEVTPNEEAKNLPIYPVEIAKASHGSQ